MRTDPKADRTCSACRSGTRGAGFRVRRVGADRRIAFYDGEASVLGPGGEPAPRDPSVTGAPDAERAAAVTRAEAEARAARQPGALVGRAEHGSGWFALGGESALTDAAVAGAEPLVIQAQLSKG
jgi:hypothetical protein